MPGRTKAQLNKQLAPWRKHLAAYKAKNSKQSLKEQLKGASKTYAKTLSAADRKAYKARKVAAEKRVKLGQHRPVSLAQAKKIFRTYYANNAKGSSADYNQSRKLTVSPCKEHKNKKGAVICYPQSTQKGRAQKSYLYRRAGAPGRMDMKGLDDNWLYNTPNKDGRYGLPSKTDKAKNAALVKLLSRKVRSDAGVARTKSKKMSAQQKAMKVKRKKTKKMKGGEQQNQQQHNQQQQRQNQNQQQKNQNQQQQNRNQQNQNQNQQQQNQQNQNQRQQNQQQQNQQQQNQQQQQRRQQQRQQQRKQQRKQQRQQRQQQQQRDH